MLPGVVDGLYSVVDGTGRRHYLRPHDTVGLMTDHTTTREDPTR